MSREIFAMGAREGARARIFQTAAQLFYRYGYRAVGVDMLAAEAGIGKMSLYRHFASKDDLIVAYLEASEAEFWARFAELTRNASDAREILLAFFAGLQGYVTSPACFGCPFLNVIAEYPDVEYRGHQVAHAHKQNVRACFVQLARAAGAADAEGLASGLHLLMDGAYMAARLYGASTFNPAAHVVDAARDLIDAHTASEQHVAEPQPQGDPQWQANWSKSSNSSPA